MNPFEQIIDYVLEHEGGLSMNPKDPGNWTGGRINAGILKGTRYGISAAAYPEIDIQNLTLQQAKDIYQRDYWHRISGNDLPAGLNYSVFDAAVNAGVRRAIRWLQKSLRIKADGIIGAQTLEKLKENTPFDVLRDFQAQRLYHYMRLTNLTKTYGYGWSRRTLDVYAKALKMIDQPNGDIIT
jgi:lysozyme family protein